MPITWRLTALCVPITRKTWRLATVVSTNTISAMTAMGTIRYQYLVNHTARRSNTCPGFRDRR
ncbi:Uncharacterised protein [Mycobacterium tuberculosis]|nr:Uncharacterised protein [Mycobacterium tuberculosis]